jgi:hypothetical protein
MTELHPITRSALPDGRQSCILISTCIGYGLQYLLRLSAEFNHRFVIRSYITQQHFKYMKDFDIGDEEVAGCALLLHLTPGWADWGNEAAYSTLLQRFGPATQKISFPYPTLLTLWPFHCGGPRNVDPNRPLNVHGKQAEYHYGDTVVLAMLKEGIPKREIIDRYLKMDIPAQIDLLGVHRWCMSWQGEKEKDTDVKVLNFINNNLRTVRTFSTMKHITNATLIYMANQILAKLGMKPLGRYAREALFEIVDFQMPIHPSIIRALDLPYVTPESRYRIDAYRNLTFAEYLDQYIDFT